MHVLKVDWVYANDHTQCVLQSSQISLTKFYDELDQSTACADLSTDAIFSGVSIVYSLSLSLCVCACVCVFVCVHANMQICILDNPDPKNHKGSEPTREGKHKNIQYTM